MHQELDTPPKKAMFVLRIVAAAIEEAGFTPEDVQEIKDSIAVSGYGPLHAIRMPGQGALHDEVKLLCRWLDMAFDLIGREKARRNGSSE